MPPSSVQPASVQSVSRRPFGQSYAFVVVAVIFLALLASAGLRSTPGVLMLPLQKAFGWDVSLVSSSAAVGIFLYGLAGPFAAAVMQRFGIRRTVLGALALMSVSTAASYFMTAPWQLFMSWGLLSGIGSGAVANVLGATIVNRWFTSNRGLVMGLLTASTATGTLIFMPGLASLVEWGGWQPVVLTVAACCAALIPLVYFLVPERPASIGLRSYGSAHEDQPASPAQGNPFVAAIGNLVRAAKTPTFWFLFATFFICGLTTNGLVGTHLIAFCGDHGIFEVQAASLLALMGFFDLFGTTLSGWLTDRFDPRKLLFFYYGLRGLSLIYLPYSDFSLVSLTVFAAFYGLDWIATVPPTVRIANETFGDKNAPLIFGWVVAGH
jgi:MFS family permease